MRKMASIQKIIDIQPIEGADAIEKAQVGGWWVVIAKADQYKIDDMVIYAEVDSWVPNQLAPFLSKGQPPREYNGVKGERLRTVRLRGQISQGLILPMKHLTNYGADLVEGTDVSEMLGIQKYEPPLPACLGGVARGNFPSQIPKTDENRVQNLYREWPKYRSCVWRVTEKLDGSSTTFAMIDGVFHTCSRNMDLVQADGNTFWNMARRYDIESKMRAEGLDNFAIQGETIGSSIQGNKYNFNHQRFYVFKMYDIIKGEHLSPVECEDLSAKLGLLHVPVVAPAHTLGSVDDTILFADGESAIAPGVKREGVVFRRLDGQEHFKSISNAFLIKHSE